MENTAFVSGIFTVLEHIPLGVCDVGEWQLHYANAAMQHLLKIDANMPSQELNVWLSQGSLVSCSDMAINERQEHVLFRRKDEKLFIVSWWPITGEGGDGKRCISIMELPAGYSITQLSEQSWLELDNILEYIHDGIWIIDGNGITRRVNKALERIAGIRADEVVGLPVTVPMKKGRFKTCVSLQALKTRQTVTLFDDYANGKRCLNTSTPIFDAAGNILSVIAVIRDMTELEELQRRLSRLEVEAMAYKLRARGLDKDTEGGLMGQSLLLEKARQDIVRAANADTVTLILGETGTGKSMAAKLIHEMSSRAEKPFIALNCGAISPSLMEAEIFGYESGAFTGASRGGKPGMLELANGGTLLLDEIGELSLPMQVKLLHVLDEQPFYRVGGTHPIKLNARLIAATNRPLEKMVARGEFREDLFYRLRVLNVIMPSLRERREDILLLAWHFLHEASEISGRELVLDPRTEKFFLSYRWPGNVRELKSVIQSLATLNHTGIILPTDLPAYMHNEVDKVPSLPSLSSGQSMPEAMSALEKKLLSEALAETGSTYKAARRLGISQSSVVRKARKYGICTAMLLGLAGPTKAEG